MNSSKERLYIAYGSNLNLGQMSRRCPTAKIIGGTFLRNYRLMFRGRGGSVATVEYCEGEKVPVLIWRLQPEDEEALDAYEGWPRLYRKEILRITVGGKRVYAMIYIMNEDSHPYGTPSFGYLETIRRGYESAGFDTNILEEAVNASRKEAEKRGDENDENGF